MSKVRNVFAALILMVSLSIATLAGDMHGDRPAPPPPSPVVSSPIIPTETNSPDVTPSENDSVLEALADAVTSVLQAVLSVF